MDNETKEELQEVRNKVDWEGFEYAFINYSSWDEIKDPTFQKLKEEYINSHKALEKYIMDNTLGEEDMENDEEDEG